MKKSRLTPPTELITDFNSYSTLTEETWSGGSGFLRSILGISGEAGEVSETVKKHLRGDYDFAECQRRLIKELGDVLYYIDRVAKEIDADLSLIATANIRKLYSRYNQNLLKGDGSEREEKWQD